MERKIIYGFYEDVTELSVDEFIAHCQFGKGWKPLVKELCNKLFELGWNGNVQQCKEKFGSLCFYTEYQINNLSPEEKTFNLLSNHEKKFFDTIYEYENKSAITCEMCGGTGMKRHFGRVITLCLTCSPAK